MNDWSLNLNAQPKSARLFPIPGLVMFPHVMQPLHVFEHRYRALLADALDDDQLIALPILASCEQEITSLPSLEPVACLTKIVSHQKLADGCSNLLVKNATYSGEDQFGVGTLGLAEKPSACTANQIVPCTSGLAELVESNQPPHLWRVPLTRTLVFKNQMNFEGF